MGTYHYIPYRQDGKVYIYKQTISTYSVYIIQYSRFFEFKQLQKFFVSRVQWNMLKPSEYLYLELNLFMK